MNTNEPGAIDAWLQFHAPNVEHNDQLERNDVVTNPGRRTVRVGTRGSALALRQTELVIEGLRPHAPDVEFEVRVIRTAGDADQHRDASQFEGQGIFVHTIEQALRNGEIDIAVHSAKDMPSALAPGLALVFPVREDPRDALVSRDGRSLAELPPGARVGTGSPRRRSLLLHHRPDLEVVPIRGNVDTRMRRAQSGDLAGVVVAAAGLRRLGRELEITELLAPSQFVPAVSQGILAIETRSDDSDSRKIVQPLDHGPTRSAAETERQVALTVGAGCQTAIGAFAEVQPNGITVSAFLGLEDGELIWAQANGPVSDARQIGQRAGEQLMAGRDAHVVGGADRVKRT
jgi:hydroxymethylbilane synthase